MEPQESLSPYVQLQTCSFLVGVLLGALGCDTRPAQLLAVGAFLLGAGGRCSSSSQQGNLSVGHWLPHWVITMLVTSAGILASYRCEGRCHAQGCCGTREAKAMYMGCS